MRCMSCGTEASPAKFWEAKVLLCPSCHALAESLTAVVNKQIALARDNMMQWAEQHILSGGLLRDLSTEGQHDSSEVQEVRSSQGGRHPEPRSVPEGVDPSHAGLRPASGVHPLQSKPTRGDY